MHHLINDLAQLVSGEFSVWLEDGKVQILSENARHLSYFQDEYDAYKRFDTLSEVRSLRTFLALQQRDFSQCHLSNKVLLHFLPQVRFLRVLSLFGYCIIDLPDSIGNLKHLRYLDLSCTAIQRLPDSMEKLINLRYLDVSGTKMTEMSSVGELKSLQSLTHFVVGQMNGSKVGELMKLSDIRGRLCISKLDNVRSGRDALKANLKDKRYLDELVLTWDNNNGAAIHDGDILENFQPHTNLKRLYINSFGGLRFPDWVGDPSFFNLMYLELRDCDHCTSLPPLGQLPSLKHLVIFGMHGGWNEWLPCGEFPHLQELYIRYCPKLTGKLPKQLPSLKILEIVGCPELLVASLGIPTIRELKLLNCGKVLLREPAYGLIDLQMLERLSLKDCPELLFQREGLPSNLSELEIGNCSKLTGACENMESFPRDLLLPCTLTSLQLSDIPKIRSCPELQSLARASLQHPTALKRLKFRDSPKLQSSIELQHQRLVSLEELGISHYPRLQSLTEFYPQCLASLKEVGIWDCPELRSLTEAERLPDSLSYLIVNKCPLLEPRCQFEKGQDWPYIAHIPHILIDYKSKAPSTPVSSSAAMEFQVKHASGSPSSSTSTDANSNSNPTNQDPMQSWWESISKARARIHALSSILSSPSPSISSLADSDRPARSLLQSPDVYDAVCSSLFSPQSGSGPDPICQWLYETFQSSDPDLRLVALSFIPLVSGLYLSRVVDSRAASLAGFEAVLLALYASELKARGGKPVSISIPDLSQPSLYHTPRSRPSSMAPTGHFIGLASPPLEPQSEVKSTKRACIVGVALDCYYKQISQMPSWSKLDLCRFAAAWAGQNCPCKAEFDRKFLIRTNCLLFMLLN
ncbi:unnamed protein product, partial [Vitis vinifera]